MHRLVTALVDSQHLQQVACLRQCRGQLLVLRGRHCHHQGVGLASRETVAASEAVVLVGLAQGALRLPAPLTAAYRRQGALALEVALCVLAQLSIALAGRCRHLVGDQVRKHLCCRKRRPQHRNAQVAGRNPPGLDWQIAGTARCKRRRRPAPL